MENFIGLLFLVCFSGAVVCYLATVITIRKFMPDDWSWRDIQTLGAYVWKEQIPVPVRRRYVWFVCWLALAIICIVPLAVMKGESLGIFFAVLVAGGAVYQLYRLWFEHYGEF